MSTRKSLDAQHQGFLFCVRVHFTKMTTQGLENCK